MSTHDYVIDNQSAVAFRADLNSALSAIVTQNSNATAPTTTFANMIWYDTATNILKKRNEANSAWINLGTVNEAGGTFTPTGGTVTIATQAQAEAGTDNTTMMTPLRVAQAIDVQAPVVTTSNVLSATAGATQGAVGTYAFLRLTTNSSTDYAFGATLAGSALVPASMSINRTSNSVTGFSSGAAVGGTWRLMGFSDSQVNSIDGTSLWLRIA